MITTFCLKAKHFHVSILKKHTNILNKILSDQLEHFHN